MARVLSDDGHIHEPFHHFLQVRTPKVDACTFSSTQSHLESYLVSTCKEFPSMGELGLQIVFARFGTKGNRFDLILGFGRGALGLLVTHFPIIENLADRRACLGGHFDEIETSFACDVDGISGMHDTHLFTGFGNDKDFRKAYLFVYSFSPFRH